jgi:hypothetical protein
MGVVIDSGATDVNPDLPLPEGFKLHFLPAMAIKKDHTLLLFSTLFRNYS